MMNKDFHDFYAQQINQNDTNARIIINDAVKIINDAVKWCEDYY